jgi:hypothetical protein
LLQGGYLTIRDPIMRLRCRSQVIAPWRESAAVRLVAVPIFDSENAFQLQLLRHHEKNMTRLYDGLNALAATRW